MCLGTEHARTNDKEANVVTAPGGGRFNLTAAALKDAENRINAAAEAVHTQFIRLEREVLANPSKGAAFRAAHRVAAELKDQALQFQNLTQTLAGNIGFSAKNYVANSDAGVQAINAVTGTGASFNRLVGH